MMNEIWIALIGVLTSVMTGVVTYFTTKKKQNAEAENIASSTTQVNLNVYKDLIDSYREDFLLYKKEQQELLQFLKEQNIIFQLEVSYLKDKVINMIGQICLNFTCSERIKPKEEDIQEILKKEKHETH